MDKLILLSFMIAALAVAFVINYALAAMGHPSAVWVMRVLGVM